jgi:myo-inositol-1(or 4)-monophosphatase
MKPTQEYLDQAEKLLMEVFHGYRPKLIDSFGSIQHSLKADHSVVTKLDVELETKIREALADFDPGVGVEGEELGKTGSRSTFWLVDPIDGTESFIRGLPLPRNIVTLIDDGEPVYALIYRFITDEKFTAIKNQGAKKNDQPLHVSNRPLDRAWINYSTALDDPKHLKKFLAVKKHVHELVNMKEFVNLATGAIEGVIWDNSAGGVWDYAPRGLLFKEAGAQVSNAGSEDFNYLDKTIIAAGPTIYPRLKQIYEEN